MNSTQTSCWKKCMRSSFRKFNREIANETYFHPLLLIVTQKKLTGKKKKEKKKKPCTQSKYISTIDSIHEIQEKKQSTLMYRESSTTEETHGAWNSLSLICFSYWLTMGRGKNKSWSTAFQCIQFIQFLLSKQLGKEKCGWLRSIHRVTQTMFLPLHLQF